VRAHTQHLARGAPHFIRCVADTPQGIMNAVAASVRSIEHGNFIDDESAACMRTAGAYFVRGGEVFKKSLMH